MRIEDFKSLRCQFFNFHHDDYNWTLLLISAEHGHWKICQLIMKSIEGTGDYETALELAAEEGQVEVCKLFLDYFRDKNLLDNLIIVTFSGAVYRDQLEVCKLMLEYFDPSKPTRRQRPRRQRA